MKSVDMRIGFAILCWVAGGTAAARGEDLTTLAGQTYSNVVVQRFDRQGLFIDHDGGSARVLFKEILPELCGHYRARARFPLPVETTPGEKEEPAGPNDLTTLSGQIYRNVVVKKVDDETLRIAHDGGMDTVYFSSIPPALREKYRTQMPVVPDPAPDADDLVATYGQVFRNVEIRRVEPDGLTFRHDGGVTKLWFPSLPEELREKHGYDPIVAWKYQREAAAANKQVEPTAAPAPVSDVPAMVVIHGIETEPLPDNKFWVRFAVKNLTDKTQTIRIVACEQNLTAIMGGKVATIPANAPGSPQQIVVPEIRPQYLKITCGTYFTNCLLNWEG